jgi:hypothetical protein
VPQLPQTGFGAGAGSATTVVLAGGVAGFGATTTCLGAGGGVCAGFDAAGTAGASFVFVANGATVLVVVVVVVVEGAPAAGGAALGEQPPTAIKALSAAVRTTEA